MRTYTYTPSLKGLTVIKTDKEQSDEFWVHGHPEFVIPDFNPDGGEDIWTSFLTYLEKNDAEGGEVWDQNGGECTDMKIIDPTTGLTRCCYIADDIQLTESGLPQEIKVYVEGYIVKKERTYFLATKVEVDLPDVVKPMTFCFTGIRLNELQAAFDAKGWVEKSGVAKGLDYLVAKDPSSTSGKAQKARDLGVKVISLDEFKAMLGPIPEPKQATGEFKELTPEQVKAYSSDHPNDLENDRIIYDIGFRMVETTIGDLAVLKAGTTCGSVGNQCFIALAKKYGARKVVCWYNHKKREVNGMPMIECTEAESEKIDEIAANKGDGSLRANGEARIAGFQEFEVE